MNDVKLYQDLLKPFGVSLSGIIGRGLDGDILVGGESLKAHLKTFFDVKCKSYWHGFLDSQPESYAIQYIIIDPQKRFYDKFFLSEWVGGTKGYDWVIENNEDIFDYLSEYEGCYLLFGI